MISQTHFDRIARLLPILQGADPQLIGEFIQAASIVRIVAGIALVAWGLIGLGGTTGIIVAVIGALPLMAGLLDFCAFAPLFGNPLSGPKIRAG